MKSSQKSVRPVLICLLLLSLLFFFQAGMILNKTVDKSMEAASMISNRAISCFLPGIELSYWGERNTIVEEVIDLFLPTFKHELVNSSIAVKTIPSGYYEYCNAMMLSDITGKALASNAEIEKTPVENQSPALSSSTTESIIYSADSLKNYSFLVNEFYTVDRTTYIDEQLINFDNLYNINNTVDKSKNPTILIYHTHSQEAFCDSPENDPSKSIVAVGSELTKHLHDKYGYKVIHNTDTFDIIDGKLDRSKAYDVAEKKIKNIIKENPNIVLVIDLHRDGIDGEKMTVNYNGKEMAKLMFLNGLSRTRDNGEIEYLNNPNRTNNLSISFQLQLAAKRLYPNLMRKIYLKGYEYNLRLMPRCLLIEAGSQKNTFQEEVNAMEPLSEIINDVLSNRPVISQ